MSEKRNHHDQPTQGQSHSPKYVPYARINPLPFFEVKPIMSISEEKFYYNEYVEYKTQIEKMEAKGDGDSKACHKLRATAIGFWNKLLPSQQREIAEKYIPERA